MARLTPLDPPLAFNTVNRILFSTVSPSRSNWRIWSFYSLYFLFCQLLGPTYFWYRPCQETTHNFEYDYWSNVEGGYGWTAWEFSNRAATIPGPGLIEWGWVVVHGKSWPPTHCHFEGMLSKWRRRNLNTSWKVSSWVFMARRPSTNVVLLLLQGAIVGKCNRWSRLWRW